VGQLGQHPSNVFDYRNRKARHCIVRPGYKQLVWRGSASKTLDINEDPDKNYRNLEKAVAKLFKNYPPDSRKR
jgi:hypothetical protein